MQLPSVCSCARMLSLVAALSMFALTVEVASSPAGAETATKEKSIGVYQLRIVKDDDEFPEIYRFEIRRGDQVLVEYKSEPGGVLDFPEWAPPDAADITGSGQPEVVIQDWSMGAHCCLTALVYQLGPTPTLVAKIEARDNENIRFEQRPSLGWIGRYYDWTFMYWNAGSPQSPGVPIAVTYRGGGFHLVPDLMRTPRWSRELMDQAVDSVRSDFADCSRGDSCLPPALWAVMLSLVYSGHLDQAREFFERAWPMQPGKGWKHAYWEQKSYAASPDGRQQFWTEFMAQLAYSPYWADLQAMNNLPPLPGQLDRMPQMAAFWLGLSDKYP